MPASKEISILTSENSNPKSKKFDVQQYFLDEENNEGNFNREETIVVQNEDMWTGVVCLVFLILIVIGIGIGMQYIINNMDTSRAQYIVLLSIILFLSCLCIFKVLKSCSKYYKFSRDIKKNRFYVKKVNLLNCSTIEIDSSLGNYYIQCKEEIVLVTDEQGTSTERVYRLYLYNQLSDTSEYDLDTSNVKKVPLKLFLVYKIYLYRHNEIELETKLNNFICA